MSDSSGADALGLALSYWMQTQNNKNAKDAANRDPKFYDVPLTPNEQWKTEYAKNGLNFTRNYAQQFLQGLKMPSSANYHFKSSYFKGDPFAGGFDMPNIDWTKMMTAANGPATPGSPGSGPAPGSPAALGFPEAAGGGARVSHMPFNRDLDLGETIPGPSLPEYNQNRNVGQPGDIRSVMPRGADGSIHPFNPSTGTNMGDTSGSSHPGDPAATPGQGSAPTPGDSQGVISWAENFAKEHPWVWTVLKSAGVATGGPLAGLAVSGAQWIYNHYGPGKPAAPPAGGSGFIPGSIAGKP